MRRPCRWVRAALCATLALAVVGVAVPPSPGAAKGVLDRFLEDLMHEMFSGDIDVDRTPDPPVRTSVQWFTRTADSQDSEIRGCIAAFRRPWSKGWTVARFTGLAPGTRYEYSGEAADSFVTDATGRGILKSVPAGSAVIAEVRDPDGRVVLRGVTPSKRERTRHLRVREDPSVSTPGVRLRVRVDVVPRAGINRVTVRVSDSVSPPGTPVSVDFVAAELDRRRSAQVRFDTRVGDPLPLDVAQASSIPVVWAQVGAARSARTRNGLQ